MYYCELCDFKSPYRNNLENHHIVPKELNGSDKPFNRVFLCGKCHSKIYVKGSKSGIHSIKTPESIIIKGWFTSTNKQILIIESQNVEKYIIKKNLY